MHSVRLNINDKIYDNLIWYLSKFSKEELEIIIEDVEDVNFTENKEHLEKELKEIYDQKAKFISVDEVEERLEKIIRKHENNL